MNCPGAWRWIFVSTSALLLAPVCAPGQALQKATKFGIPRPPRPMSTAPKTADLEQELQRLHAELADLESSRPQNSPGSQEDVSQNQAKMARLRTRVIELVLQLRLQRAAAAKPPAPVKEAQPKPAAPTVAPGVAPPTPSGSHPAPPAAVRSANEKPVPPTTPSAPPQPPARPGDTLGLPPAGLGKAVDPWALAVSLFQAHDYEHALQSYRALESSQLPAPDHVMVQYMIGCCLRHLDKLDEAAAMYREVVNSRNNEILADCARWQLGAIHWRQETAAQLAQFRQRRQATEDKP